MLAGHSFNILAIKSGQFRNDVAIFAALTKTPRERTGGGEGGGQALEITLEKQRGGGS